MQKSPSDNLNHSSNSTHRTLQHSSTLNRRYVSRPTAYDLSTPAEQPAPAKTKHTINIVDFSEQPEPAVEEPVAKITHHSRKIAISDAPEPAQVESAQVEPVQVEDPIEEIAHIPTAAELKNLAVDQALEAEQPVQEIQPVTAHAVIQEIAEEPDEEPVEEEVAEEAVEKQPPEEIIEKKDKKAEKRARKEAMKASKKQAKLAKKARKQLKVHRGRRIVLAFSCAAACIAIIGYLIYTNAPDLSVRVAAIQTGIDAKYPSYIPRDYQMASVSTNQEGSVTIDFAGPDGNSYTLTEKTSTWDSNALLNNYVKPTWGDHYDTLREQGITIYISGSDAVWVNGGMFYNIDASAGNLTKKQIKTIVTSL